MRRRVSMLVASLVAILGVLFAVSRINISALPEPGNAESYVATRVKRMLVRGNSRHIILPATSNVQASIVEGEKLFGVECAACHGMEGTNPTDAGRWMYPRAPNLASSGVQQYSDAELFWIVKNGIRLTGMPAYGPVETDANIGHLVCYVRSLRQTKRTTLSK